MTSFLCEHPFGFETLIGQNFWACNYSLRNISDTIMPNRAAVLTRIRIKLLTSIQFSATAQIHVKDHMNWSTNSKAKELFLPLGTLQAKTCAYVAWRAHPRSTFSNKVLILPSELSNLISSTSVEPAICSWHDSHLFVRITDRAQAPYT